MKIVFQKRPALALMRHFTSNEETRYYLQGVAFQRAPKGLSGVVAVATDGHVLGAFHDPAAVFEAPKGIDEAIVKFEGDALKMLNGVRNSELFVMEGPDDAGDPNPLAAAECDSDGRRLTGGMQGLGFRIDGTFPDWKRVVERPHKGILPTTFRLCLGAHVVARLAAANKLLDAGAMTFFTTDPKGDGPFHVRHETEPDFVCIAMPMRGAATPELPSWIEKSVRLREKAIKKRLENAK